jgi:response regulator RpfG family c-di-GMP phosphodiesterase
MPRIRYTKQTILLYEGDAELAENIKLYLEDIYVVNLVNHSEQIISELDNNSYDFLISDLNSLNIQFGNIVNEIQTISPSTKIILMCTFFDAEINNERFILSKVDDYIFKPFNVNLLKYKLLRLQASSKEVKFA